MYCTDIGITLNVCWQSLVSLVSILVFLGDTTLCRFLENIFLLHWYSCNGGWLNPFLLFNNSTLFLLVILDFGCHLILLVTEDPMQNLKIIALLLLGCT